MTALLSFVRASLPTGVSLTAREWRPRHRVLVAVALMHVPVLFAVGVANGFPVLHAGTEVLPIMLTALLAAWPRAPRRVRTLAATISLVTCSAILVHMTDGLIESHFHFFVVVATVMLYHDWIVFVVAFGYVIVHHGVVGLIVPESVFNHSAALERPLVWALIHGGYIAAASAAGLVNWHFNEQERSRADAANRELEHAVDRLAESNRRLEVAVRARDEFLSRVSHELRTPLTSIRGFAELLAHDEERALPARHEAGEAIARNSRRLERLIDDLLHVEQSQSGVPVARRQPVRLAHVVSEVLDERAGGPQVETDLEEGLEVVADPNHLHQILTNLLTNAERYGAPPVVVAAKPHDSGMVDIRVRDHGAGVPDEFAAQLFDRFAQASVGDRRTSRGLGLGLWIVASLAEANGGSASYQDADGGGACFVVRLPGGVSAHSRANDASG